MILIQGIEIKFLFLFLLCIFLFSKDKTYILCVDKLQCMFHFSLFFTPEVPLIISTPKYSH